MIVRVPRRSRSGGRIERGDIVDESGGSGRPQSDEYAPAEAEDATTRARETPAEHGAGPARTQDDAPRGRDDASRPEDDAPRTEEGPAGAEGSADRAEDPSPRVDGTAARTAEATPRSEGGDARAADVPGGTGGESAHAGEAAPPSGTSPRPGAPQGTGIPAGTGAAAPARPGATVSVRKGPELGGGATEDGGKATEGDEATAQPHTDRPHTDRPHAEGPRTEQPPTAPAERAHAHHQPPSGVPPKEEPKNPGGGLLMGRPFGVPVYVAPSWFLVAALITWVFGGQLDRVLPELGNARYLVSLFFAVAFYASVLVHELAHTVAALRFKLPVRRIQLQFFGGVSEIEKESETPGREFVLAFVGPLLSLVLAGVFYAGMRAVEPGTVPGVLLAGLMISNLIVAAFNLLPGLPLDGGRMLRAVVWKITGRPMSGTVAAAWVGRALAISVLIGLPILNQSGALGGETQDIGGMDTVTDALLAAILAAIIWTGAGNSLRMARLREHLPELRARALTRRAVPVETDTPLSEALRRANAAGARALVVVDADGDPLSVVREAAIVGVPEHRRPWVTVSGLAQDITEGMRIPADVAGEDLLDRLRTTPASEYLVVEESGEIYGVLSAADVERAFVKAMARPS
nr:site-2 protease family protein [Streptomyces typhae]